MCHRADRVGYFLMGLGAGLIVSMLLGGWFLPVVLGLGLAALGWFLTGCG